MTNSVFIDTSILVENTKGNKKKLLADLLHNESLTCFVNETVVSKFMFFYLKINGESSPLSSQERGRIPAIFSVSDDYKILNLFHFLPGKTDLLIAVPTLMAKYNLLPNDAIILATCKIHGITQLASHDADFVMPCRAEGIELLTEE